MHTYLLDITKSKKVEEKWNGGEMEKKMLSSMESDWHDDLLPNESPIVANKKSWNPKTGSYRKVD